MVVKDIFRGPEGQTSGDGALNGEDQSLADTDDGLARGHAAEVVGGSAHAGAAAHEVT